METAPIAIFVYKRPEHTRRLIDTLKANPGWERSPIFVFSDGPKSERDAEMVGRTREVVRSQLGDCAQVFESAQNKGLARSIIAGVTDLTSRFGSAIVLEDDLELSAATLGYFNSALERYRDEPRVMHISAYMFPVDAPLPDAFFYREATCWGWATWSRAWSRFISDGTLIRDQIVSRGLRQEFDVGGTMRFFDMLEGQIAGRVDSWAIRWYGSMFLNGGLALHPGHSLTRNEGFDGTGVNSLETSMYEVDVARQAPRQFPREVAESEQALQAMMAYRRAQPRTGLAQRIRRKLRSWF